MPPDKQLLDLLADVDPSDPLWDDMDALIVQLRTLAADKLASRAKLDEIKQTLVELSTKFSAQLEYFGFKHFHSLHEQPDFLAADGFQQIQDLVDQLDAHAKFDLSASGVAQAREKRQELDHLEAKILETLTSLDAKLGRAQAPASVSLPLTPDVQSTQSEQKAHQVGPNDRPSATAESVTSNQTSNTAGLDALLKKSQDTTTPPLDALLSKPNRYFSPQAKLSPPLSLGITSNRPPLSAGPKNKITPRNRRARRALEKAKEPSANHICLPRTCSHTEMHEPELPNSESTRASVPELTSDNGDNVLDCETESVHQSPEIVELAEDAPLPCLEHNASNADSSPAQDQSDAKSVLTSTALLDPPLRQDNLETTTVIAQTKVATPIFLDRTWKLLESDDIAGAYWSEVACGKTGWTTDALAALQASRWMTAGSSQFCENLLELSQLHTQESGSTEESLLKFAAALVPSLIAPSTGMVSWLTGSSLPLPLFQFSSEIIRFAHSGISLEPFELLKLQGSEAHKAAIQEISARAAKWLNDAQNKTTKFWRTSRIWLRLTERGGALHEMLLPVSSNVARSARSVREALSRWEDRNFVVDQIEQIDRLRVASPSALPGSARDQLLRFIQEACSLCAEWVGAVESANARQSDWTTQQIEELRSTLDKWRPTLFELSRQYSESIDSDLRIIGIQVRRSFSQLFSIFGLPSFDSAMPNAWTRDLRNLVRAEPTLESALRKRLLFEASAELADDGAPLTDWLTTATFQEARLETRELLNLWISRQDFRFVDQVLSACEYPEVEVQTIRELQQKDVESAKKQLRDRLAAAQDLIERAVIDGLIAEERSEFLAELEQIDADAIANFRSAFEILDELESKLQSARNSRASYIAESWTQLRSEAREKGLEIPEHTYSLIKKAVTDGDVRVADEAMSILRLEIEAGVFSSDTVSGAQDTAVLRSFWNQLPKLADYLRPNTSLKAVIQDLRRHHLKPSIFPPELSDDCRIRGADILDDFRLLKEEGPRSSNLKAQLVSILDWLGFGFSDDASRSVAIQKTDNANYAHLSAKMSAGQHAPVPLFGSQSANRYDVLLIWNHFAPNQYATLLKELKIASQPLLVFFFGRLDQSQRLLLRQESHKLDLPGLVVDEALLLFLIPGENKRLQMFFECSLPFARTNPYAPFQYVPPEVFFGRQEAARALHSPTGTCLVFGGRQLGKSALLQHVQREFSNPKMEHYAWVMDIQAVGNPKSGQPASSIWIKLRDKMQEMNLLSSKLYSNESDRIAKTIKDALHVVPHRRVTVMFDEADHFLNADAAAGFAEVGRLRSLMVDTDRRLKVIFAGLHNVQRFQGIPNQPLAHFGTPICIGPLEPASAIQLVKRPFSVLGFDFEDDSCVHKILSYTNYHPGLIQLFGQELLHSLRQRSVNQLPATITVADVEGVYKDSETRNVIRERFELTLGLDNRYQAVAYAIIVDQLRSNNAFSKSYSAAQLLGILRDWLPVVFENQSLDEFRGILDEMAGLGVLSGAASGYYRLRSPNLVRLMGTESDIENKLLELASKPVETQFDADGFHPVINPSSKMYSPFTNGQERALNAPRFGVLLIHGSDATGISQTSDALSKFAPPDCPGVFKVPEGLSATELAEWFRKTAKNRDTSEKVFCYLNAPEDALMAADAVSAAIEFCRGQRVRNKLLRILILFSPQATANWCNLPLAMRQQLENEADSVMPLKPWSEGGIQHRLAIEGKSLLPDVCKQVALATGGWPILLDEVIKRSSKTDDPRTAAKSIHADLIEGPLKGQLRTALGIPFSAPVDLVWQFIKSETPVQRELVLPELIEGSITSDECNNAILLLERLSLIHTSGNAISPDPTISLIW